mgnify:CR=1
SDKLIDNLSTENIAENLYEKLKYFSRLHNNPNYKLQKISKLIDANEELLALDNHLVYLYLDKQPLTPVVHPNIIFKDDEYELLISS